MSWSHTQSQFHIENSPLSIPNNFLDPDLESGVHIVDNTVVNGGLQPGIPIDSSIRTGAETLLSLGTTVTGNAVQRPIPVVSQNSLPPFSHPAFANVSATASCPKQTKKSVSVIKHTSESQNSEPVDKSSQSELSLSLPSTSRSLSPPTPKPDPIKTIFTIVSHLPTATLSARPRRRSLEEPPKLPVVPPPPRRRSKAKESISKSSSTYTDTVRPHKLSFSRVTISSFFPFTDSIVETSSSISPQTNNLPAVVPDNNETVTPKQGRRKRGPGIPKEDKTSKSKTPRKSKSKTTESSPENDLSIVSVSSPSSESQPKPKQQPRKYGRRKMKDTSPVVLNIPTPAAAGPSMRYLSGIGSQPDLKLTTNANPNYQNNNGLLRPNLSLPNINISHLSSTLGAGIRNVFTGPGDQTIPFPSSQNTMNHTPRHFTTKPAPGSVPVHKSIELTGTDNHKPPPLLLKVQTHSTSFVPESSSPPKLSIIPRYSSPTSNITRVTTPPVLSIISHSNASVSATAVLWPNQNNLYMHTNPYNNGPPPPYQRLKNVNNTQEYTNHHQYSIAPELYGSDVLFSSGNSSNSNEKTATLSNSIQYDQHPQPTNSTNIESPLSPIAITNELQSSWNNLSDNPPDQPGNWASPQESIESDYLNDFEDGLFSTQIHPEEPSTNTITFHKASPSQSPVKKSNQTTSSSPRKNKRLSAVASAPVTETFTSVIDEVIRNNKAQLVAESIRVGDKMSNLEVTPILLTDNLSSTPTTLPSFSSSFNKNYSNTTNSSLSTFSGQNNKADPKKKSPKATNPKQKKSQIPKPSTSTPKERKKPIKKSEISTNSNILVHPPKKAKFVSGSPDKQRKRKERSANTKISPSMFTNSLSSSINPSISSEELESQNISCSTETISNKLPLPLTSPMSGGGILSSSPSPQSQLMKMDSVKLTYPTSPPSGPTDLKPESRQNSTKKHKLPESESGPTSFKTPRKKIKPEIGNETKKHKRKNDLKEPLNELDGLALRRQKFRENNSQLSDILAGHAQNGIPIKKLLEGNTSSNCPTVKEKLIRKVKAVELKVNGVLQTPCTTPSSSSEIKEVLANCPKVKTQHISPSITGSDSNPPQESATTVTLPETLQIEQENSPTPEPSLIETNKDSLTKPLPKPKQSNDNDDEVDEIKRPVKIVPIIKRSTRTETSRKRKIHPIASVPEPELELEDLFNQLQLEDYDNTKSGRRLRARRTSIPADLIQAHLPSNEEDIEALTVVKQDDDIEQLGEHEVLHKSRISFSDEDLIYLYSPGKFLVHRKNYDSQPEETIIWKIELEADGHVALLGHEPWEIYNEVFHCYKYQNVPEIPAKRIDYASKDPKSLFKEYLPIYIIQCIRADQLSIVKYYYETRATSFLKDVTYYMDHYKVFFQFYLRGILYQTADPEFIPVRIEDDKEPITGSLINYIQEAFRFIKNGFVQFLTPYMSSKYIYTEPFLYATQYPKLILKSANCVDKTRPCDMCPEKKKAHRVIYFGCSTYNPKTFEPNIGEDETAKLDDINDKKLQLCQMCSHILRNFHNLYHHPVHIYYCCFFRYRNACAGLKANESLEIASFVNFIMSDFDWVTRMELDFTILLAQSQKDAETKLNDNTELLALEFENDAMGSVGECNVTPAYEPKEELVGQDPVPVAEIDDPIPFSSATATTDMDMNITESHEVNTN